jgi:hypothetical protein
MSENFESTYESLLPDGFSAVPAADTVSLNQDFWENDGISLTGNPYASPDQIVFTGSGVLGGLGNDHITFNPPSTFNLTMTQNTNKNGFWKYNEDKILKQLEQYISGTYSQHYVDRTGGGTEQTLDKIKHNRREGFCAGNVTKYIDRYDTKGTPRADLFKVLHYTILLINHLNLIENK